MNCIFASQILFIPTYQPAQAVVKAVITKSETNEIPVKKVALCRKLLQKRVCKASSENQVKARQSNPRPIKANNTFFCLDVKVN